MRAAITRAVGGPIELAEVPDPERRSGEVRIRVHAAAVDPLDRLVYDGEGPHEVEFPLIQGIGVAGVVEEGSGSLPTGIRVVVKPDIACGRCRWCMKGRQSHCARFEVFGVHRPGGLAQLMCAPRPSVFSLPGGLTFADGAAAVRSHPLALRMIRSAGDLPPDAVVAVTGAGSALGTAALQLVSSMGLRSIGVASSGAARLAAAAAGATTTIDRSAGPPLAELVSEVTDGRGADLLIDTTAEAVDAGVLARGGRAVVAATDRRLDLDLGELVRSRRAVIGSAGSDAGDLRDALRMLEEHDLRPVVPRRHPLDDAQAAMDATADLDRIGTMVVVACEE